MEGKILQNLMKFRLPLQKTMGSPLRSYSNVPGKFSDGRVITEDGSKYLTKPPSFGGVHVPYWNEYLALRKQRRLQQFPYTANHIADLLRFFQSFNDFPKTFTEFLYYFRRRWMRRQVAEQTYLPERVAILKPDLAAVHFLVPRGGLIKFFGSQEWVGFSGTQKTFPLSYVPGLFVEAIKADGTNLIPEGLANFNDLKYLTSLSLKNLESMNDWCMDHISKEHYLNLKHLDISGCKNITYRGLSCFYRFECLKTLNVEGIPDPPEFKLACLMLLDIMPELDIQGIDLTIPKKIEPLSPNLLLNKSDSNVPSVTQ